MRRQGLDVTWRRGGGRGGEKGDFCFKSAAWLSVSSASRFADVEWDPAPPSWTCWGAGGGILQHPPFRAGAASHRLREGASWGAGWHGGLSQPCAEAMVVLAAPMYHFCSKLCFPPLRAEGRALARAVRATLLGCHCFPSSLCCFYSPTSPAASAGDSDRFTGLLGISALGPLWAAELCPTLASWWVSSLLPSSFHFVLVPGSA